MIGKLLTLVILFTIGWVIYAKFFGNEKEKQIANNITSSFSSLVSGITGAIRNEVDKGTFQKAFQKTSEAIDALRNDDKSGNYAKQIAELEAERKRLESQLETGKQLKSTIDKQQSEEKTRAELKALADKIDSLSKEMQKQK